MKIGRLLVASATPCFAWAFIVGCGDGGGFRGAQTTSSSGTTSIAAGAGAGGMSAGAAGLAGAAGSAQGAEGGALNAGSGGSAITAGQAGSAGADVAGMGGLAGAAGAGGAGGNAVAGSGLGGSGATGGAGAASGSGGSGVTGGSGGSGVTGGFGGVAGLGGASGNGGSAGATGPLRSCGERCNSSADCRIFGFDQGFQCNSTTHRCERFADPCRSAVECIPEASFWIFTCRSDADCFFFSDDLCVDVGGVGRCARLAPSANGCMDPNPDELTLPRFGTSGSALVCANTSRTCEGGECVPGCSTNTDCTPQRNGSVCDTQTHLCRCVADQDCGGAGVSRCNTTTGLCECSTSRECEELPNANTCFEGRCGCSGVSACNADRAFSGTTIVCE